MKPLVVRALTAPAPGGVAVVAITGRGARAFAATLARRRVPVGVPVLARLVLDEEPVDEALVVARTEDEVEFHLHGSVPLVRCVLDGLARLPGVARAADDEFGSDRKDAGAGRARRPSLEEHALDVAARAASSDGARIALDQARGSLRAELEALSRIDGAERARRIALLLERARIAQRALEPALVVLAGPVNAGKSTLFNALLGHERAITSALAGTTRDALVEPARFGPWPVLLADTAGERADTGVGDAAELERAGQALARRVGARADLVVRLEPTPTDSGARARVCVRPESGSSPASEPSGPRRVLVRSRAGVCALDPEPAIAAVEDPEGTRRVLERLFRAVFALPARAWTSGAPTPLDPELVSVLGTLSEGAASTTVRTALEPWLGSA